MKIGDIVYHVDYPNVEGMVVARYKPLTLGVPVFLVKWSGSERTSRHIESALRRAN